MVVILYDRDISGRYSIRRQEIVQEHLDILKYLKKRDEKKVSELMEKHIRNGYEFIKNYLEQMEYDDYDKLIILCDALADAKGFCILEKRFVDTARRYGFYPFSLDRWNNTYKFKEYFEECMGKSIYTVLPEIEKCIYM